jgi:hypothetical protein
MMPAARSWRRRACAVAPSSPASPCTSHLPSEDVRPLRSPAPRVGSAHRATPSTGSRRGGRPSCSNSLMRGSSWASSSTTSSFLLRACLPPLCARRPCSALPQPRSPPSSPRAVGSPLLPYARMPSRREGMQFCIPSILHWHFASPFASPVAERFDHASANS